MYGFLTAFNGFLDKNSPRFGASLALWADMVMADRRDTVFAVRYLLLLVNRLFNRLLFGNHLADCSADFNDLHSVAASAVRTCQVLGLRGCDVDEG